MAQQILENNQTGLQIRTAINENFTDVYTNKAPTAHDSPTSIYGVGSNTKYGHLKVNNTNGLTIVNGELNVLGATTTQVGVVQLNDNINSTSTTQAATANSVKKAATVAGTHLYGNVPPASSLGANGDIYIQI